jgi:tetratricopeptide (TPR) repeat protein
VAKSLYLVGDRMRQRGKLNESQSILTAALTIQRKLLGEHNPASLDTLRSLGLALEAEGKLAEAEAVHREILAVLRKRGENKTPQALSELETLTRILIVQKKFGDAEQILNEALAPEFVSQPASANLLVQRVDLKARRGFWQEAATDAALVFQYQPSYTENYCVLAALLAKTQNRPAYETFCQKILATHSNTTDLFVADRVAKACLFLPSSEVDLKVVGHLADTTVTLGVRDEGAMPFFQVCKALSEYRQGHFVEAADWAQKTVKIPGAYAHGHAYAVLAMAYWRLEKKEEAQAMLANGETVCPRIMPMSIAEERGSGWTVWLFARVSLDEATDLIQPGVTNNVNSNHP